VAHLCHLSAEICENRLSSFYLILQTNKQSENITSLAEVKKLANSVVISSNITAIYDEGRLLLGKLKTPRISFNG